MENEARRINKLWKQGKELRKKNTQENNGTKRQKKKKKETIANKTDNETKRNQPKKEFIDKRRKTQKKIYGAELKNTSRAGPSKISKGNSISELQENK